uniref:Uncharacterized protein n=1 Tax=Rhizophora mucronata TaxID=61149 RepID=A0A2P2K1T3_RHIMU
MMLSFKLCPFTLLKHFVCLRLLSLCVG